MKKILATSVFAALPFAADAADLETFEYSWIEENAPVQAGHDFYLAPSGGVIYFDLPAITANAKAFDGSASRSIDLSPDFDEWGPAFGLEIGARLGETGAGTLRLRGSGFYAWAEADDSVQVNPEFGAFAMQGIWGGNNRADVSARLSAPMIAGAGAAAFGSTTFSNQSARTAVGPPWARGTGIAISDLGSAYAAAGSFDSSDSGGGVFSSELGIDIEYDSEVQYWGGEVALVLDRMDMTNGPTISPFIGGIYRGLQRDLTTTVMVEHAYQTFGPLFAGAEFSLDEKLEGQYYGGVVGVDITAPLSNGARIDLSLSGAPLYLHADYSGYESNAAQDISTGALVGPITTPVLGDSDDKFAGLLRARAGISIPVIGNILLELNGQVEYLTASPTIKRTQDYSATADSNEVIVGVGDCCDNDPVPLAALDFEDMFAYSANLRLIVPFGD